MEAAALQKLLMQLWNMIANATAAIENEKLTGVTPGAFVNRKCVTRQLERRVTDRVRNVSESPQ